MSLTLEQRKERYYKFAKEKADRIYSLWEANKLTSKQIVAKAYEYAFDSRLKTNAEYRFYAYAFALALRVRLENRYGTFLRRLFRFLAYIRERNVLKTLKSVLGFNGDIDIREMLDVEVEKITVLLANRPNGQSTGGGKSLVTGEITMEELDEFFEECLREDEPNRVGRDSSVDKDNQSDTKDEPFIANTDDRNREKISVKEFGKSEQTNEIKKEKNPFSKRKQSENQTDKTAETDNVEKGKTEKSVEKTVANTSILAETLVLAQDRKETAPSPFPVFREKIESNPLVKGKEDAAFGKENGERKNAKEESEHFDKDIREDGNRGKSPFPVFDKDKILLVKPPENTVEKEVKISKQTTDTKVIDDAKTRSDIRAIADVKHLYEMTMHALSNISEENRTRGLLNITMSETEINLLAEQVKLAAKLEMAQEEQVWREQISIENTGNEMKVGVQNNAPSSNKDSVVQGLKK